MNDQREGRESRYISSPANSKINFKFNNYTVVTQQPLDGVASAAFSATGLWFPLFSTRMYTFLNGGD